MDISVNVNHIPKDSNIKSNFKDKSKGDDSFLETFNKLIGKHEFKESTAEKDKECSDISDENITMSLLSSFLVEPPVAIEETLVEFEMEPEFINLNVNSEEVLEEITVTNEENITLEKLDIMPKTEETKSFKANEVSEFSLETSEKQVLDLEKVKPPTMKQSVEVEEKESSQNDETSFKVDRFFQNHKGNKEIVQSNTENNTMQNFKTSINETVEIENRDTGEIKEFKTVASEESEFADIKTDTMETPKNLDTNFMFNRIQNMFFNLELDEMNDTLSAENLQNIKDSMVQFMQVSKEGDTSVMKVKLYPEELGSINISLKLYKGGLIADIMVESEKIKALFLNSSNLLNRTLVEQDVPVKNINVSVNDNFNSFENFSEETSDGHKHENSKENLNRNNGQGLESNSLDDMRIKNVRESGKGLSILA